MGSKIEKGGGSKDQRGSDGQKGGRKARRRSAPVRMILIIGAAVLTCGALWNHAMLDFNTAEGLISHPHGSHHRRSLLSTAASRGNSSGGLSATRKEGFSAGAISEDPEHERKQGRGSKYMPLNVVEEDEPSPPTVSAGNVLGRLLDHKLRGQRPAGRGGVEQGETMGGVTENEPAFKSELETGAEQVPPVVLGTNPVRQSASLEQKGGADAAVDDLEGLKNGTSFGKIGDASANVSGPAARNGTLPRPGVLSKLSSFLAGSPRIRRAGGSQANVSIVAAPGLQNQTGNETVQTKASVVLHNLRNARGRIRESSESELRLIEEAKRALGEPDPARGAETGASSGGGDEESADDRWDLMRIENKLKAEQEYAAYIEKLEDEKARAEAAEAARLKAEADGAGKSEETDGQNGTRDERAEAEGPGKNEETEEQNGTGDERAGAERAGKSEEGDEQNEVADERNGKAEERDEVAEERKEGPGGEEVAKEGAQGVEGVDGSNREEASAKGEAEGGEKEAVGNAEEVTNTEGEEKMGLEGEQVAAQSGGQEAEPKSEGGAEALEIVTDSGADATRSEEVTTEEQVDGNQESADVTTGEASSTQGEAKNGGTWEADLAAAVELENPASVQGAEGDSAETPLEKDASEGGEGKAAE